MILPILTIMDTPNKGRGVFALEPIAAGTIIEIAPVLVLDPSERAKVEQTLLYDYIFEWGEDHQSAAVALGYVSIYNHSDSANCKYDMDFDFQTITITTLSDIEKGAELLIHYNGEGSTITPDWFKVV
jgi:SET domain-containing protein